MAQGNKNKKDWEAYDKERMAKAVAEIKASPFLRFFLRSLLAGSGVNETPEGANALLTARACGRHSIGMDVVTTLRVHDAALYPLLLTEDNQEQQERGTSDDY